MRLGESVARAGWVLLCAATVAAPFDKTPPGWPSGLTNRQLITSGRSIQQALEGTVDLLLTDMPMTDAELSQVQDRRGVHLIHIATAVTAVVPCYNLAGIREPLNFSADVLARIFEGKISKWNDPAITAMNPDAHLTPRNIVVVGHAVEDGSTYTLTDFLSKATKQWKESMGPVRSLVDAHAVVSAERAEDIPQLVKQTPDSISFTELWAAKQQNIQIGRVRNSSGRYIEAGRASMAAAAQTAAHQIHTDFRASITNTHGPYDYPLASFTWVVIPDSFGDPGKSDEVVSFLKWILTDGQASSALVNLAPLPRTIADRELTILASLH